MAIKFLNTATAATQSAGDNSTKIATTAYADAAAAAASIGNYLPLTGGTIDGQILISNTFPALDFVDTNSFTDPNDRFRVRAGGNQGLMQWYDDSSSSLLTLMTLNPNGDVIVPNGDVGIGTSNPGARLQVGPGTTNQQSQVASIGTSVDGLTSALSLVNQGGDNSDGNGVSLDFHNADNWSATGRISVIQPTAATGVSTNSSMQFSTYGTVGSTTSFEPRMTIDYAGNVGIGTTSPAAKLEVKKSSYNAGNAIANFVNGNDPVRVSYDTVVIAQTDVPTLSIVETIDGSQANEQKLTFSVGDNKAVIASTSTATSGMYFNVNRDVDAPGYNTGNGITALKISNNGNVGIGTTNPDSKLDVRGPSATPADGNQTLSITNSTGGTQLNLGTAENSYGWIEAREGSTLRSLLLNPNGGNVGIGTTSPTQAKLVVDSSTTPQILVKNSSGTNSQILFEDNSGGTQNASITYDQAGENALLITTSYDSPTDGNRIYLQPGGETAMTLIGGNNATGNAGNVGIGTTNPTAPLDVYGVRAGRDWAIANRAVIRLDSNGAAEPSDILFGHTATANQTSWTGAYWSLSSRGSSDGDKFHFYRASGNPTVSSEAIIMTFDPNLNVGIGTTSPSNKLSLSGSGQNWGTSPAIKMWDSYNSKGWYVGSANNNTIGDFYIRSVTGEGDFPVAADQQFTIKQSGNVGIGTISPGYTLDVNGSLHSTNITIADAIYHEGDTNTYIQFHSNDQWRVVTSNIERLEVTSSQVLVNNSYFKIQNSGDRLMDVDTVNGTFFLGDVDGLSDENYITSENGRIDLVSGGGETLSCTTAGKVGIGDINPSTKLSVNGGVQIANESATASAALVGTIRYRSTTNTSFVDMCMQTGATTYTWVNIVSNFW